MLPNVIVASLYCTVVTSLGNMLVNELSVVACRVSPVFEGCIVVTATPAVTGVESLSFVASKLD